MHEPLLLDSRLECATNDEQPLWPNNRLTKMKKATLKGGFLWRIEFLRNLDFLEKSR